MLQLQLIIILTISYFSTILVEILLNSSVQFLSPQITFFGHIQSSLSFTTLFDSFFQRLIFLIFFLPSLGLSIVLYHRGIFAIYITLLKFFELIPVLIDLINILFIYQYKIKEFHNLNSFMRLNLSLSIAFIRLLISFDFVCQKFTSQRKKQLLFIVDFLLFILINITLIRYSNKNFLSIGRKIILGLLMIQFNGLTDDKTVWIDLIKWNSYMKHRFYLKTSQIPSVFNSNMKKTIHLIIIMRWILPLLIICWFVIFTLQSIVIDSTDQTSVFIRFIYIFYKTRLFHVLMSIIILFVIYLDKLYNQKILHKYGLLHFCTGLYLVFGKKLTTTPVASYTNPTVITTPIVPDTIPTVTTTYNSKPSLKLVDSVCQKDSPKKKSIFSTFLDLFSSSNTKNNTSLKIERGLIEVEKGDITKQQVDVIIGSSSSENLRQVLLKAGGDQVQQAYNKEYQNNPNSLVISTPSGNMPCKNIFFFKWKPDNDPDILQQSIIDLIWSVIQHTISYSFTSIAFPAIGCGGHGCSVDIIVKTMVKEMKTQMQKRKLPWTVKFIIHPSQQNVYDEFCKQLLLAADHTLIDYRIPSTWRLSKDNTLLFIVSKDTDEYKSIINKFHTEMQGKYREIIKLERIQNERWYMQYIAHSRDFIKRLNQDTEKRLYHGCPETAADLIIKDCFNRSFAGVNGVAYGFGVYFSKNATYSNGYALPNSKEERHMFVARVLVGKTTRGNSTMKTRPLGFDSTTDGNHIFVTYHDAQAYAEYLITYK